MMTRLPSLKSNSLPSLSSKVNQVEHKKNYGQGRGGRPWRRLKQQIHQRDNWTCCSCGRVTMELECDHIINQASGGTDDEFNLQSLCKTCHAKKSKLEARKG